MRRVDELQESNIFPPQVTIAANRMVKEGILPEETVLPVSIQEGKEIFGPWIKEKDQKRRNSEVKKKDEVMASFQNITVRYRSVKGEAPKRRLP